MQNDGQPILQEFQFDNLPVIADLSNSGNVIQAFIKGSNWQDSYNCITELRKINKYHAEYVPNIIEMYCPVILDLFNNGRPLLVKNILKLIKQLFDAGRQINVEKVVESFLPVLIKKASTDIGYMKISAQQVLTSFSANCGYEISFIIASQHCCDKNSSIAQLSIKLLAVLIEKVGSSMMQLSENTLLTLMKALSILVDGKRQNLRILALDICMFICESIGGDNYLTLMNFCLNENEIRSMGTLMQNHRQNKQKPIELKRAIKDRRTEIFNQDFFKVNRDGVVEQKPIYYDYNQNNSNSYNNFNHCNQKNY